MARGSWLHSNNNTFALNATSTLTKWKANNSYIHLCRSVKEWLKTMHDAGVILKAFKRKTRIAHKRNRKSSWAYKLWTKWNMLTKNAKDNNKFFHHSLIVKISFNNSSIFNPAGMNPINYLEGVKCIFIFIQTPNSICGSVLRESNP